MLRQLDLVRRESSQFEKLLEAARKDFLKREKKAGRMGGAGTAVRGAEAPDLAMEAIGGKRALESLDDAALRAHATLEAIVLEKMRPAYFIVDGHIEIKSDFDRTDLVRQNKALLERAASGVGRVDLVHHRLLSYAGTGWLIEKNIAVTNRHVASIFAEADWQGSYQFKLGAFSEQLEARLDYVRDRDNRRPSTRRAEVVRVIYIAGPHEPDFAFLEVTPRNDTDPLTLSTKRVDRGLPVAAVGYPASDGDRNDPKLMDDIFGGVYDVKRFSPGLVTGHESGGTILLTDYTTLGGNSGSPVLNLETGEAVALHFAGAFKEANYAVSADIVGAAWARLKNTVRGISPSGSVATPEIEEAPTTPAEQLTNRDGYQAQFLGKGKKAVPLPKLGRWAADVAPVSDDPNGVLKYRHFSVIQSASRRLPLLTAVNIDGAKARRIKRQGDWKLDGRLDRSHQAGNELYTNNPFDRGHMVRRRDPGWGKTPSEAEQGELDTFHYTNAAPQHENLNQREWASLEDYILDAVETHGFRATVFTGPVLRDDDRKVKPAPGRPAIQIPEEFWKIAVTVDADTGMLNATGYVLSQGRMIRDLVEAAFVFGQYKTYQVQIARIEQETGLDFGKLREFDPLGDKLESSFRAGAREVNGPEDLWLRRR